jgi:hypothetical protein
MCRVVEYSAHCPNTILILHYITLRPFKFNIRDRSSHWTEDSVDISGRPMMEMEGWTEDEKGKEMKDEKEVGKEEEKEVGKEGEKEQGKLEEKEEGKEVEKEGEKEVEKEGEKEVEKEGEKEGEKVEEKEEEKEGEKGEGKEEEKEGEKEGLNIVSNDLEATTSIKRPFIFTGSDKINSWTEINAQSTDQNDSLDISGL